MVPKGGILGGDSDSARAFGVISGLSFLVVVVVVVVDASASFFGSCCIVVR